MWIFTYVCTPSKHLIVIQTFIALATCVTTIWHNLHFLVPVWLFYSLSILVKAFVKANKKKIIKIWNRVDCQRSEKRSKNAQEIKRTLFNVFCCIVRSLKKRITSKICTKANQINICTLKEKANSYYNEPSCPETQRNRIGV